MRTTARAPTALAKRWTVRIDGLPLPLSMRATTLWVVPMRAATSPCVKPACVRAAISSRKYAAAALRQMSTGVQLVPPLRCKRLTANNAKPIAPTPKACSASSSPSLARARQRNRKPRTGQRPCPRPVPGQELPADPEAVSLMRGALARSVTTPPASTLDSHQLALAQTPCHG
jgi:hypothetical protein